MTFKERIQSWAWVQALKAVLSRVVLPGFQGVALYQVIRLYITGLNQGKLAMRASAMAYNFFMASFPGILFFFTLLPYLPVTDLQTEILKLLKEIMPTDVYNLSVNTIADITNQKRTGLLSLVFFASLYFSTTGVSAMMSAFNYTYHQQENRSFLRHKLVSLFLTLILSVSVIVTATLLIVTTVVIDYVQAKDLIEFNFEFRVLVFLKYLTAILMTYLTVSIVYYFGPAKRNKKSRFFTAGSTLTTILFLLFSYGFTIYLNYFNQYNKLYGSIGAIIIFMLWIYLNSYALLLGYELNASISSAKKASEPRY